MNQLYMIFIGTYISYFPTKNQKGQVYPTNSVTVKEVIYVISMKSTSPRINIIPSDYIINMVSQTHPRGVQSGSFLKCQSQDGWVESIYLQ